MTKERTLGELVTLFPNAAKVFHRVRLDYCCGGTQSLKEACAAKNLDAENVLREIQADLHDEKENLRWDERPLDELIEHILEHYHAPLRTEIPRLVALAAQVGHAHADKPDCPRGLHDLLVEVQAAVETHLAKEEQILFPLILAGRGRNAHMPVQVMMQEHEDHGQNLQRIRDITKNLAVPEYACASWRELYRALDQLEVELMNHIHLENNLLFPRALTA